MTRRIPGALAAATVALSLGIGNTALATALFADNHNADNSAGMTHQLVNGPSLSAAAIARRNALREWAVFGATPPEPLARAFSDEYLPATPGSESQNAQARMMEALDTLIFATGVMTPPADQLNSSTGYGTQGMFSTGVGDSVSHVAMMLPGFDIVSNIAAGGGRGPSPATAVPEPATGLLLLAGALGLIAARRR